MQTSTNRTWLAAVVLALAALFGFGSGGAIAAPMLKPGIAADQGTHVQRVHRRRYRHRHYRRYRRRRRLLRFYHYRPYYRPYYRRYYYRRYYHRRRRYYRRYRRRPRFSIGIYF